MQLSIEIQTNAVSTWRGSNFTSAKGKRYGRFPVLVRFTDNGVAKDLGTGASGLLGIKIDGEEEYLAVAHPWEKVGSGAKTFYVFDLNLNTEEIEEKFGAEAAPKVLAALLEIRYQYGLVDDRTATISYEIGNAINSGDVPPPVSGQPAWPLPSEVIEAVANAAAAAAAVGLKISLSEKGASNGVATLGGAGKIPLTQLPDSSEAARGVIRQATAGETIEGADTAKAVHPAGLAAALAVAAPRDAFEFSGAGTETTNGVYTRNGNSGARAAYFSGANSVTWSGGTWDVYDDVLGDVSYYSFDDVAYPWLVSTWEIGSGDGAGPTATQSFGSISDALYERAFSVDVEQGLSAKANDAAVVHNSGTETVAGSKTFTGRFQITGQPSSGSLASNDGLSKALGDALYGSKETLFRLTSNFTVNNSSPVAVTGMGTGNILLSSNAIYFVTWSFSFTSATSTPNCRVNLALTNATLAGWGMQK